MATAQSTQNGAASFYSIQDKLAAIIYLLNTNNMTAEQIQANAVSFQPIQDKLGAIIYLLATGLIGGVQNGTVSPVGAVTPTAGYLYFITTDKTLWAADGTQWNQLV